MWKVVWAHPDFGQLLATCSQDRTVKIWVSSGRTRSMLYAGYIEGLRLKLDVDVLPGRGGQDLGDSWAYSCRI